MRNNTLVTVFGDSVSKGIITEDGRLCRVKQGVVDLVSQELGVKINNLSSYGQTISKLCEKKLVDDYLKNLDTSLNNIAVISLGGNDSDFYWKEVADNPYLDHKSKTPLPEFESLLLKLIRKLKNAGVKVFVTSIPPINSKLYFENVISKIADAEQVLKFLNNDISVIYRYQESYNIIINKIVAKTKVRLLDIRTDLLTDRDFLAKICSDGVHPNQISHMQMAKTIISQLKFRYQCKA